MTNMIPFRLGNDDPQRFDILVKNWGLKRPLFIRNLLSLVPILIDDIEAKTISLNQMSFTFKKEKEDEKAPEVISIRLDEEQERRFNGLVVSLGVGTKAQLLRNLISGDPP